MTKVLAIDAGGTKILYALVDETGEIVSDVKKEATPKDLNDLINVFKKIIKEYEKESQIVAFATAGAVNSDNTRVSSSTPNMPDGYNQFDFSSLSSKPVYVENDANSAAWAEYKTGNAKNDDDTITITIGTGIGGGFISKGRLIRGKSGRAGEIGSMKIKNNGRICTCSRKDCFESYASGTGLKKTAEEIAMNDIIFKKSIFSQKQPHEITTYDIIEGVNKNDLYSKKVFDLWIDDIIIGLINITNIFDTKSIVISGGLGEFINTEDIEKRVNNEIVVSPVKIKHAKHQNYAGLIGTALLAAEKFKERLV